MRFRAVIVGAILAALGASSASATYRISEDRGGQIGHYLQTLTVPRERICVTSRARLGFHAAWMPDINGKPVTSPVGTQALWDIYPGYVRRWIVRRGGLSRHMLFLEGRELASMVPACGGSTARVASRPTHKLTREALRGQTAQATTQRH
jgi:hypothetical protein